MKKVLALVGLVLLVAALAQGQGAATNGSIVSRSAATRAYVPYVGQVVGLPGKVTGNLKNNCAALTAADVDFTLPITSDYFRVCSSGGTAMLTFKDAAPAVSTAANGHDVLVGDGMCHTLEITELLVAVIGGTPGGGAAAAGGEVCFIPLISPGGKPY